jgi:ComF family protein
MDSLPAAPSPDALLNRLTGNFRRDELAVSSAFALTLYDETGQFSRVIRALKYAQSPSIGTEFGRETGAAMQHLGILAAEVIVPVPIHHARRRERTYNQAELIAGGISDSTGIPLLHKALLRRRYTTTQTRLNAEERHSNLTGAFVAGRNASSLRDKIVLLTDDVLTTGSTINTCATALLEAGARRVDVAVLAAAV